MKKGFAVAILLLSVLMVPLGISGVNTAAEAETSSGDYIIRYGRELGHEDIAKFMNEHSERAFIRSPTEGTINVNTNIESATFTISGPATYSGSGTFWSQSKAPSGTYTITYGSVSGYKSPPSETKTLSDGGSITFCGSYLLKKMAGDSIDLRDGFILLISEVDPEVGEVLMELQLDDHIIDDKILKKGERYWLEKYYYKEDCYIDVVDIGHETTGDYVILSSVMCQPILPGLIPHVALIIASVPQGADIYLDGEYVGKTTRKISVIPDFKMRSLRLVLSGYEEEEQTFKFEQGEATKEIQMTLSKIEPTPTSTPTPMLPLHVDLIIASVPQGADIYLDGEYVGKTTRKISVIPDFKMHSLRLVLSGYEEKEQTFKFEQGEATKEIQMTLSKIEPTPTSRPTLTPSTPTPTPTPVSHAYSPTPTPPGFLAITVILAILCGFLILKRKHS